MKSILGIGNALVDIMTIIDDDNLLEKFSLPKGSMQLVDKAKSELIRQATSSSKKHLTTGGSAANTIHGLAMLGADTGFIGSVGKDDTAEVFENDLVAAGVTPYLLKRDSVTGTALALVSRDSERTFATHLGAALELYDENLLPENFRNYNMLYLEGYLITNKDLVTRACRMAKDNNMEIALDMASYNVVEAKIEDFREIVSNYVDIVFANEEEARSFTGLLPSEALEEISKWCSIAVVKTGSEGSLIKRGHEVIKVEAFPVSCLDTTGAGDLYASGFLYGYAGHANLEKCGIMGSLLAGHVIGTIGAKIEENKWPSLRKQVNKLMKEK